MINFIKELPSYLNRKIKSKKISLGSKLALGTDSGSMWVMAAYSHPSITLITNWYDNHNKNFKSLVPPNKNGDFIFKENGFSKGVTKTGFLNKIFNFKS